MQCEHVALVKDVKPHSRGCEECLKMGARWVHLRLLPELRARRLLRLLAEPPRNETLSRDQTSDRLIVRAWRGLVLVLRR